MSTMEHGGSRAGALPMRPTVYFRTFGSFISWSGGRVAELVGGGAGPNQLRRQVSWLVGHSGSPVKWEALRSIAGGYGMVVRQRPFYVVLGLIGMLRRWGLESALLRGPHVLTLMPSALWGTDGDELEQLLQLADEHEQAGDPSGAIRALELAATHCGDHLGHRYLEELVDALPPDAPLCAQASYWSGRQREALHRLACLCIASDERRRHQQGLTMAKRALRLDGITASDYLLAAQAATRCGQPAVASAFQQKASQLKT